MTEEFTPEEEDFIAPAEYVLRLLTPEEERAFETRMAQEPALRNDVAVWTEQFASIGSEFEAVAPPRAVKARLMRELFGPSADERPAFWNRLTVWRSYSLLATAMAAGFAALFLSQQQVQPPRDAPLFVSEIAAEDNSLRVLAVYDPATAQLRLNRTTGVAEAGRDFELWAIVGDNPPVSLGVLPDTDAAQVELPEALRASVGDVVLAISDEPDGGSDTGAPTGAVLAVGQVSAL